MKEDIAGADVAVISGSLVDWGDELIPYFALAVRLVTPKDLRIARLIEREKGQFGSRVERGGDLYQHHCEFLRFAERYDDGGLDMRSRAKHDEWQTLLSLQAADIGRKPNAAAQLGEDPSVCGASGLREGLTFFRGLEPRPGNAAAAGKAGK